VSSNGPNAGINSIEHASMMDAETIAVPGNQLEDIRAMENVSFVMKAGKVSFIVVCQSIPIHYFILIFFRK
jgi:hypothetical protein